jgi:hypothetical protein
VPTTTRAGQASRPPGAALGDPDRPARGPPQEPGPRRTTLRRNGSGSARTPPGAAMFVFLYPENILLPSLRRQQTPAFQRLVSGLAPTASSLPMGPAGRQSVRGLFPRRVPSVGRSDLPGEHTRPPGDMSRSDRCRIRRPVLPVRPRAGYRDRLLVGLRSGGRDRLRPDLLDSHRKPDECDRAHRRRPLREGAGTALPLPLRHAR